LVDSTKNKKGGSLVAKNGVPNNIAILRKEKGFTQKDFAEKIGISNNWLNHIENASRKPSLTLIDKIAKALGVTKKDIFLD
jgi:transcriptional regulator with XRE-family HTH domain